jgi:hypothetical protein
MQSIECFLTSRNGFLSVVVCTLDRDRRSKLQKEIIAARNAKRLQHDSKHGAPLLKNLDV